MQDESMMRSFQNTELFGENKHKPPLGNHSVSLGELVTAAFDCAAQFSDDPKTVSRSAVLTVAYMLRHMQRAKVAISSHKRLAKAKPRLRVACNERS